MTLAMEVPAWHLTLVSLIVGMESGSFIPMVVAGVRWDPVPTCAVPKALIVVSCHFAHIWLPCLMSNTDGDSLGVQSSLMTLKLTVCHWLSLHVFVFLLCLCWSLWMEAPCSFFPVPPLSPLLPVSVLGGLRGQKLNVGASIGLRACSQRNSSHSSEGRFHIVDIKSLLYTYLEGLGIGTGGDLVLILSGNGQKPTVTRYTGVSILCCKYQRGGSAVLGMSVSGVALPPTQSPALWPTLLSRGSSQS